VGAFRRFGDSAMDVMEGTLVPTFACAAYYTILFVNLFMRHMNVWAPPYRLVGTTLIGTTLVGTTLVGTTHPLGIPYLCALDCYFFHPISLPLRT
jgi:hypothetical protein